MREDRRITVAAANMPCLSEPGTAAPACFRQLPLLSTDRVVAAPAQSGANRAHGYLPGPAGRGSPTTDGQGAFRPSPPSAAAASPPIRLQLDPERNQTARACPVPPAIASLRHPVTTGRRQVVSAVHTAPPVSPPGHAFTVAFNLFPFVIFYCGFVCVHKGTRAGDPCWKR